MLTDEEKAPYEKMARDHNERQGYMVEACVDALKVNSQRSWENLAKVYMVASFVIVRIAHYVTNAVHLGYGKLVCPEDHYGLAKRT
jgi:hypothetical protein